MFEALAKADNLVFVTNATAAVNTVVKQLELGPEDAVLATSHTYNAVNMAVDSAVRRAGADVINVDISLPIRSERDIVGSVAAALLFKAGQRSKYLAQLPPALGIRAQ